MRALLATALLLPALAAQAQAPPPAPPLPDYDQAIPTGQLRITRADDHGAALRRAWRVARVMNPQLGRQLPIDTLMDLPAEAARQPGDAGRWRFHGEGDAKQPGLAVQVIDHGNLRGYDMEVRVHCLRAGPDCEAFAAQAQAADPPEPHVGAMAKRQWEERLLTAACRERPVDMSPPRYPASVQRTGIGGVIRLRLVSDPCGGVRHASVLQSSGNREIDLAAVIKARRWVVPATAVRNGRGLVGAVDVTFSMD